MCLLQNSNTYFKRKIINFEIQNYTSNLSILNNPNSRLKNDSHDNRLNLNDNNSKIIEKGIIIIF